VDDGRIEIEKPSREFYLTDPFIQVESQINPEYPEPMFSGRDAFQDSAKAKQREYVVKSILYKNDIKSKNTVHERSLKKYGDSFYKVSYDANKAFSDTIMGDIVIEPINIDDVYPDPSARTIDDCEFIDYVYYMHRERARRVFAEDLKKKNVDIYEISTEQRTDTEAVTSGDNTEAEQFDVQIMEHWYRDTEGDICLSILINDTEIRHVKKYWDKTHTQNKLYPFVHFYSIRDDKSFWNLSELEIILPLVDIADEMMKCGIDNMRLMASDVWTKQTRTNSTDKKANEDENEDEEVIDNTPGKIIYYGQGLERPARAPGINSLTHFIESINWVQSQIQRTTRNYDSNNGGAIDRNTTASEVQQLKLYQDEQTSTKNYDRLQAWKRLFILVDWSALEFYDDDRMIYIGVPKRVGKSVDISGRNNMQENLDTQKGDIFFKFNSDSDVRQVKKGDIIGLNPDGTNNVTPDMYYYPTIDCEVKGISKTEANSIINTLMQLAGIKLTQDNYKFIVMAIEQLDIPQKDDIIDEIMNTFEPQPIQGLSPEEQQIVSRTSPQTQAMIRKNPYLLELAKKTGGQIPQAQQAGSNVVNNIPKQPSQGI
jgi:hypothetical protein